MLLWRGSGTTWQSADSICQRSVTYTNVAISVWHSGIGKDLNLLSAVAGQGTSISAKDII